MSEIQYQKSTIKNLMPEIQYQKSNIGNLRHCGKPAAKINNLWSAYLQIKRQSFAIPACPQAARMGNTIMTPFGKALPSGPYVLSRIYKTCAS